MVSDRVRACDHEALVDAPPYITTAGVKLERIIADIRIYTGDGTLDISHGSKASRTAEVFYKTFLNSLIMLDTKIKTK